MSESAVRAEHDSLEGYLDTVLTPDQRKRVLIVSFNQWEMNTAVVAEIAVTLHHMGTQPTVALWADETPVKDVGWTTSHRFAALALCTTRDLQVRSALIAAGMVEGALPAPPVRSWSPLGSLSRPLGLYRSAIREMTYRGGEVGRAILQVHPDTDTPITDDHLWPKEWIDASVRSYAWVFDQVTALIEQRGSTALVVFNGRFLHDGAAVAAAGQAGLPILSFDFGGNDTDFDLTIDHTHDWSALQGRMRRLYDKWDPLERNQIGRRWFEERRQHADPRNVRFVESQTVGQGVEVPEGKKLVVFFSSSGDEISELDLDWAEYFYGQEGALMAVAEACRERDDTVLLVRTHPHKRFKPKRDVEDWHAAVQKARPDIHLDEFSEVDSYTLMRQADVVVTYGSTTGVEAAYAKCPVVVMGPSAYDELGCAIRVTTVEGLRDVIANPLVGRWEGAVAYGLMMMRRGFTHRYVSRVKGRQMLGEVELRDARPWVLKASDWWAKRQRSRLALR